jgi:hypothetical protein
MARIKLNIKFPFKGKMAHQLEWNVRASYTVTELILFILATLVLFIASTCSFVTHSFTYDGNISFFNPVSTVQKRPSIKQLHSCLQPSTQEKAKSVLLGINKSSVQG